MGHEHFYGICENKCMVEVLPKAEAATKDELQSALKNIHLNPVAVPDAIVQGANIYVADRHVADGRWHKVINSLSLTSSLNIVVSDNFKGLCEYWYWTTEMEHVEKCFMNVTDRTIASDIPPNGYVYIRLYVDNSL